MSAEKKSKATLETVSETKVAGGVLRRVKHASSSTGTDMTFSVFTPGAILPGTSFPVLYFLSGLTCDDTNFCLKAGAFQTAAKEGLAIVVPDTSPRGAGVEGEDADWDLGTGAGFYVDATNAPWSSNYKMYSYVTQELPELVTANFPISPTAVSITGHSMGGHGALSLALKNPEQYVSVSALAPICAPSQCPWGQKAFGAYFGPQNEQWAAHDSVELLKASGDLPFDDILIDQGTADKFLTAQQLLPETFQAAAQAKGQNVSLRMQDGYDHGYYFVAAFIGDHIRFHAERLRKVHNQQQSASYRETEVPRLLEEFATTTGQPIKCKAMVAYAPNEPLVCEEIFVGPPRAGEVRCKVLANALCHTDVYTWSGQDPEGLFPSILGHEGGCIVESVGEGVTSVKPGDKVIPCYTAMCALPSCIFCMNPKTNLCPSVRTTQGRGQMPDGTSRFTRAKDGLVISHFMGCSTFAEYTVLAEVSCAKVDDETQLEKACLFGCGVSTGLGAVWNNCKVEAGSTVAVFGLGAVGLSVVQAAQMAGAKRIVGIDINPSKFGIARELGCTDCVNPIAPEHKGAKAQDIICGMSDSGYGMDYTFDCTGNVNVMRSAVECCHKGWGVSCIIGVAASGKEISTRPFQLVIGRRWIGTAFGGWKSRRDVPRLVRRNLDGSLPVDHFITHTLKGVEQTNEAIHILESGKCLRCVVTYF